MKAAACAKHFAVHSGPEALRAISSTRRSSEKDLRETYLPAFEKLVQRGAASRRSWARTTGSTASPAAAARRLLGDILRGEWGFERLRRVRLLARSRTFTRYHQITDTPEDSAALAIESGCDLNCGRDLSALPDRRPTSTGKVSEEVDSPNAAVRLFTHPIPAGAYWVRNASSTGSATRRSRRLSTFKGAHRGGA